MASLADGDRPPPEQRSAPALLAGPGAVDHSLSAPRFASEKLRLAELCAWLPGLARCPGRSGIHFPLLTWGESPETHHRQGGQRQETGCDHRPRALARGGAGVGVL